MIMSEVDKQFQVASILRQEEHLTSISGQLIQEQAKLQQKAALRIREVVEWCLSDITALPTRLIVDRDLDVEITGRYNGYVTEYVINDRKFEVFHERGSTGLGGIGAQIDSRRLTDRTISDIDWLWVGPKVLIAARKSIVSD